MKGKRRRQLKTVRALVVTGLPPIERLMSWEVVLVCDRIEAIVRGEEHAAAPAEQARDAR